LVAPVVGNSGLSSTEKIPIEMGIATAGSRQSERRGFSDLLKSYFSSGFVRWDQTDPRLFPSLD
jgi:hypothetical protein